VEGDLNSQNNFKLIPISNKRVPWKKVVVMKEKGKKVRKKIHCV
jgi:hypothetical protein